MNKEILMKIVFATGNENKMTEVREIMAGFPEIYSLKELGLSAEAEESGTSFSENAEIKAREIHEKLKAQAEAAGEPLEALVLADDSGLCVDFMGGEPGVYSARWLGYDTPYEEKNREIISRLSGARENERGARFVCDICAVLADGRVLHTEGIMEGEVAKEPAGAGGFGYDPILWLSEYGKTSAEISAAEKNAISHRGKALRAMRALLQKEGIL